MEEKSKEVFDVLPTHMGGGPHGLGDPDCRKLRKVEKDVIIPKRLQLKARDEKCHQLSRDFSECGKKHGLLLPFKCRTENYLMKECLVRWYKDPTFSKECAEEYITERSEYRRTGISKKQQRKDSATF